MYQKILNPISTENMTAVVLYAMEQMHIFTTDTRDQIDTHGTIHNVKGTKVLADSIKGKVDLFILNNVFI